jgi:hypothetical protein
MTEIPTARPLPLTVQFIEKKMNERRAFLREKKVGDSGLYWEDFRCELPRCSPKLGPEDLGRVRQPTDRLTDPPLTVSRLYCSAGVFTAGSLLVEGLPLLIV